MASQSWSIDTAHSIVSFWVRHLMISKVHGRFTTWSGSLAFDEQDPKSARVEVQIDAASIDTREPQRDAHLRSPDFLDVEKFPSLTFRSTGVEQASAGYKLTGDLTLHGVTKPVTLDVEYAGHVKDPQFGERVGFSAHTTLLRKDFDLTWNQVLDAGGLALGDKVEIHIELEATKAG